MKKLKDILDGVTILEQIGSTDREIASICFDSRKAGELSLFVAVKGTQVDGHKFIPKVLEQSASVVVCEEFPEKTQTGATFIKTTSTPEALGIIASNFYDNPSKEIKLVGVTGTNGKTTIVNLLQNLFLNLGYQVGMLSTIENKINDKKIASTHTTPDAITINALLKQMRDEGCSHCFMEVSSHAIHQMRISGLHFTGGVFTNITHDHLDYHKTFAEYLKAKKSFFDSFSSDAFALSNVDDKNGKVMLQNTLALKKTYALKSNADFKAKILENQFEGLQMLVDGEEAWFRLPGKFNAYNLLAVYASALLLGEDKTDVLSHLSMIKAAEGRMDIVRNEENITGIIDYAHTPDALKNMLETINDVRSMNEELITVVGAGGDRDPSKRGTMGRIAASLSNKVIFTSDNPRSEDPEKIIRDMIDGIDGVDYKKMISISNRREAIKTSCLLARPGDIILVAGKGHEKYQEINGVKHDFDDKKELTEYLNIKNKKN